LRSGTVENLHDFKGKLDKIKELKIFKKIYAVTLDKCDQPRTITQLLQPTVHLYYTNRTRLNSEKMEIDRK